MDKEREPDIQIRVFGMSGHFGMCPRCGKPVRNNIHFDGWQAWHYQCWIEAKGGEEHEASERRGPGEERP